MENYALKLLQLSYDSHRQWANELQNAHAFLSANNEPIHAEDVALLQEVELKLKQLQEAMEKLLS